MATSIPLDGGEMDYLSNLPELPVPSVTSRVNFESDSVAV
jgi:hypothetical protein